MLINNIEVQTYLGIWKLSDWPIIVSAKQLTNKKGVYCIKNIHSNNLLIGEGVLGGWNNRLLRHIRGISQNKKFNADLSKYGKDSFVLDWIIDQDNEIQRKLIENKLQLYFKENCYNTPRRQYPTQQELLSHQKTHFNSTSIMDKLNNYTKIQRADRFDECWESNYSSTKEYHTVLFNGNPYLYHVLMYILYHGNICGITSVIHHKCENKRCVNPEHLALETNIGNCHQYYNYTKNKEITQKLYKDGYSCEQISKKIKLHLSTVIAYTKDLQEKTSTYYGVSISKNRKKPKYISSLQIQNITYSFGLYNTDMEAAQNRDYFIVKNNLLYEFTLNFHNIDYNNFKPHKTYGGSLNINFI